MGSDAALKRGRLAPRRSSRREVFTIAKASSNVRVVRVDAASRQPAPRPAGHLQAAVAERYAPMQLGARVAHLHDLEDCGATLGAGECSMCMAYTYALEGGPPLPSLSPDPVEDRRAAEAAYYQQLDAVAGEEE